MEKACESIKVSNRTYGIIEAGFIDCLHNLASSIRVKLLLDGGLKKQVISGITRSEIVFQTPRLECCHTFGDERLFQAVAVKYLGIKSGQGLH